MEIPEPPSWAFLQNLGLTPKTPNSIKPPKPPNWVFLQPWQCTSSKQMLKTMLSIINYHADLHMTVQQKQVGSRPFDSGSAVHQAQDAVECSLHCAANLGFSAGLLQRQQSTSLVRTGSAYEDNKSTSFGGQLCQECLYQKLLKSGYPFSSYNR